MFSSAEVRDLAEAVLSCPNISDELPAFWKSLPSKNQVPRPADSTNFEAICRIVEALANLNALDELGEAAKAVEGVEQVPPEIAQALVRAKGCLLAAQITQALANSISDADAFEIANRVLSPTAVQILKGRTQGREVVFSYLAHQAICGQADLVLRFVSRCGSRILDQDRRDAVKKFLGDLAVLFRLTDPGFFDESEEPSCPVLIVVERNASSQFPYYLDVYIGDERRRALDSCVEVPNGQLPRAIDKVLNQITKEIGTAVAIDMMLPIELLANGGASWSVTAGKATVPLQCSCPLAFRSLDRREPIYEGVSRSIWRQKSALVASKPSLKPHAYHVDSEDDFHPDLVRPFQQAAAFFAVTLDSPSRSAKQPFAVLEAMLSAGLPIGLWLDSAVDREAAARELRDLARLSAAEVRRSVNEIQRGLSHDDFPELSQSSMTLFFDPDDLPTIQFK